MMHSQDSQEIFAQINRIIRRRKLLILGCVLAVLTPVYIYNKVATPIYEASITLVFEDIVGPTPELMSDASMDLFILNRLEEIKSRSFTEDIARALPQDEIDRFPLPEGYDQDFDKYGYISNVILENIDAYPIRNSNVILISAQMSDPQLCMIVANTASQVLKNRDSKIRKDGVSSIKEFIETQLNIFGEKLDTSESVLREFKEKNRITSFDVESQEIQKRLTDTEVLYNTAKSERESTKEKLSAIKQKFAVQREELVPSLTAMTSPWIQKLRENLIQLELQYMQLKVQNYALNHPKMIQLDEEIEQTRENLKTEALKLADEDELIDPIAQMEKYASEVFSLEIELESLKAQETALKKVMNDYNASLGTLPAKEYELVRLTREREVNHKIYMMLSEKLEEARISEAENIADIRVIDIAQLPKFPIRPARKLNLAIGLMLGLLVGVGLAFIREYTDSPLRSPKDVESVVSWPLLGTIPNIDMESNGKSRVSKHNHRKLSKDPSVKRGLITSLEPESGAAQAYKMIRTNLLFREIKNDHKILLVTGISQANGKSTTAINLAISFASLGKKTLLVDADLRMPSLHSVLGFEREPGLGDILEKSNDLKHKVLHVSREEVVTDLVVREENPILVRQSPLKYEMEEELNSIVDNMRDIRFLNKTCIRRTEIENLSFMASGKSIINPSENISTASMKLMLEELKMKFDVVLIDSPPATLVPDALVLSSVVDGVIFVVDSSKYDKELLIKAESLAQNAGATVIGVVVNNMKNKDVGQGHHYSYG
jgi:capsular exopolysaccharide synthesis family protein